MTEYFKTGKLPSGFLDKLFRTYPVKDPRVLMGPGTGLDCAVIDAKDTLFVYKSDPITFVTDNIGWYLVQINANDIVTTGASPRWLLVTLLLPENAATDEIVTGIFKQIHDACGKLNITIIGGHTEITSGLNRAIAIGTMIGEVKRENLVRPDGSMPGDKILITKSVPIEGTAIVAREFKAQLGKGHLSENLINLAENYLFDPGISIFNDARIAARTRQVTAMHDPTEGGVVGALWEMSLACGHKFVIDTDKIPVTELSSEICKAFSIDPLKTISSGALLMTAKPEHAEEICSSMAENGIQCTIIGEVTYGPASLSDKGEYLERPLRDEICRLYE